MSMCTAAASLTAPPEGYICRMLENTAIDFIVVIMTLIALQCYARYHAKAPWGWEDIRFP